MTISKIRFLAAIISAALLTGCEIFCMNGSGPVTSRTLSLNEFTGIELQGSFDVIVTGGDEQEVKAVGQGNIIDELKTNFSGDKWLIKLVNGCYKNYELTIYITTPYLDHAVLNGSGSIEISDLSDVGNLYLGLEGSGDIKVNNFEGVENLSVFIDGSGDINTEGIFTDIQRLDVRIEGSGNYYGYPVKSEECSVKIDGSGGCEISAGSKLDVTIEGSGNVYYRGAPSITTNISGSGRVIDDN